MDGIETADAIRRNSLKSIAIVLAFPLVLPTLLFGISLVIALAGHSDDALSIAGRTFFIALAVMVVITIVWLPIGYVLNQWIVDQATGARLVSRSELPRVWAMLDRLSNRCGIRSPALRIIDTEALNAYASGLTAASYCVTVTSSLVETLEDDELEGVLAHELTHILHHDVRLMVIAGVLVGTIPMVHDLAMKVFWAIVMGILNIYRAVFTVLPMPGAKLLAELGYTGMYWIGRLVAYGIGLVATLSSLMLQFALSRRREFMADAGAVTMTGKPEALMSALRKISGNATLDTALAAVRAMCIENGVAWLGLFSTHPPIEDRIMALSRLPSSPIASRTRVEPKPEPKPKMQQPPARDRSPSGTQSVRLDPTVAARYRALLARGSPERLDVIGREHLYRRMRETVQNAPASNPAITAREVAVAQAHLEAAIEELEAALTRGDHSGVGHPRRL